MAEKLGLDKRFRKRGAVDDYERLVLAGGETLDGPGDQLLAGAAGASNQDRHVALRHLADLLINNAHLLAVADQVAGIVDEHIAELFVLVY